MLNTYYFVAYLNYMYNVMYYSTDTCEKLVGCALSMKYRLDLVGPANTSGYLKLKVKNIRECPMHNCTRALYVCTVSLGLFDVSNNFM